MSNEQTLRDTFAAAALTGIIAASDDSEIKQPQAEFLARQAWLVADAMLRERARNGAVEGREMVTDHDAAPAAKAEVATGTGHTTREPVAWLVLDATLEPFSVHRDKAQAICDSNAFNGMIFPLYRDPPCQVFLRKNLTLTDDERAALRAIRRTVMYQPHADAIDAILARLGGGE